MVVLRNGFRLTLPALDEALFALDGLLDYRASVMLSAGACRLQLQLRAAPDGPRYQSPEIRNALFRAEMLQQSFLDGSLLLESVDLCNENWFTDGAAKRTLRILSR